MDIESDDSSLEELRKLYPHLSDEEREEVKDIFEQYVAFVLRMYERISQDPESYARFKKLLEEHKKTAGE